MDQLSFNDFLLDKYGNTTEVFGGIHHYESLEVKDNDGVVVFPKGLRVDEDQTVTFFDRGSSSYIEVTDMTLGITNYQYEEKLNNEKREIFVLNDYLLKLAHISSRRSKLKYLQLVDICTISTEKQNNGLWRAREDSNLQPPA